MILNRYVFIEDPASNPNKVLILDVISYVIAQVWQFRTDEELQAWVGRMSGRGPIQHVDGYRIAVAYVLNLREPDTQLDIPIVLLNMADFYEQYRLKPNAPRYARYKIQ